MTAIQEEPYSYQDDSYDKSLKATTKSKVSQSTQNPAKAGLEAEK